MKVEDLMDCYPIYHIDGHIGCFGNGSIITSIEEIRYGQYEMEYRDTEKNIYGVTFANGDDNVPFKD